MLQKDCLQSQHTAGARSGPAPARVVEHRPTTELKVVAPGLLENFQLRETFIFKLTYTCNWYTARITAR